MTGTAKASAGAEDKRSGARDDAATLRAGLAARILEEGLKDWELSSLTRWIGTLRGPRVAEGIELVEVALNSSRKGRHVVLWLVSQRMRDTSLPHPICVQFLRWVVASRVTPAKAADKLTELELATSDPARTALLTELANSLGDQSLEGALKNAHTIYVNAARAVPHAAWPTRASSHLEPEPSIGAKGTVRLVLFMAHAVEHLALRADKKAFNELVELAEIAIATDTRSEALVRAAEEGPREGPLSIARSACGEARTILSKPDHAGANARPAAIRAATMLFEKEGVEGARTFLQRLDDELRRLDIEQALTIRKKSPSRAVACAVYRGVNKGDKKERAALWLAELEAHGASKSKRYGLLAKQGRLWTWTEGVRDEVLATIPDDHFEQAVLAARAARV